MRINTTKSYFVDLIASITGIILSILLTWKCKTHLDAELLMERGSEEIGSEVVAYAIIFVIGSYMFYRLIQFALSKLLDWLLG